ncbi:MAG: metallophosphoesterase, partial [Acidimicrobiia bacterium]
LERVLAESTAPWKIVAMHHPPYSAGYHGSDIDIRRAFSPIFERYHVQLVLAGHDHDYQRSEPINGVTYVVSGAAAKTRPTGWADFTEAAYSVRHFVDLRVWPDRLLLQAINQEGVFDQIVIHLDRAAVVAAATPEAALSAIDS